MMTFRNHRLRDFAVPMGTNWLLNDIAEAKGKQGLYTHQSPQMLKALREMALVQSVESSNRIEGVTVAPGRLRPLVLGHARPQDRSEEDITGYRRATLALKVRNEQPHKGEGIALERVVLRRMKRGTSTIAEWQELGAAVRVIFRPHPEVDHAEATHAPENNPDVPVNVPVNTRQEWFLEQLGAGKKLKAADIADQFTVTIMTAKRDLADLKNRGMIEFVGAAKTGRYRRK